MADVFRWTSIFVCAFNVGMLVALYQQVGHAIVPRFPMRTLMLADALSMAAIALVAYERLGKPLQWSLTPPLLSASVIQLVALVALYRWYRSLSGREHREYMTDEP